MMNDVDVELELVRRFFIFNLTGALDSFDFRVSGARVRLLALTTSFTFDDCWL